MPTAAPTFVPQKVKTSILKIYSYKDRNPRGILINPCFKEGASFQNLTQLLFLIEDLQNGLNYPQKGMDDRSFDKKNIPQPSVRNAFRGAPPSGKCLATFQVNILFRAKRQLAGKRGLDGTESGVSVSKHLGTDYADGRRVGSSGRIR